MSKRNEAAAQQWAKDYVAGATIEEIALDAGSAACTVRKYLHALDTPMRPAAPQKGKAQGNSARNPPRDQHSLRPTARIVRPSLQRGYR